MPYVLALDQGTTSSRAILFDRSGSVVGTAQREFRQIYPDQGWVEHDPLEIWNTQLEVARQVLADHDTEAADLAAVGITNQRETTLLWDRRTGDPLHHAIVWQDRRTAALCDELKRQGHEDLIRERTGLVLDPYFSGTKLRWLLDQVPSARQRAEAGELAFGTVDTWLVWKLTGGRVHATDVSNASRTMLFDIQRLEWDRDLLAVLDIPAAVLPEVCASSGVIGEIEMSLLGASVPIAGIAGDQQAALFGQACFEPGQAKTTYGTGCFLLETVGDRPVPSRHRLLSTVAWQIDGRTEYALEGSVFMGGAVVQWLRDGLGLVEDAAEVEELARGVENTGGVVLVPAFAGLGAPHWDPYARGTIVGLTRGTTAGHLARAALEGIAFQVYDLLDAMQRDAELPLGEMRADGGAAANDLLLEIQADLLGVAVVRPRVTETTALGAAYLAGLAVGFWQDRQEIAERWTPERTFEPQQTRDEVAERQRRWQRALERARGWEQP